MTSWPMRDRASSRHAYIHQSLTLPLQLAWRTALSGAAVSPAVSIDGQLYISTYRRVYALDLYSGDVLWEYKPEQSQLDETQSFNKATPAIWRDHLYITDFPGTVYCLNRHSGQLLWENKHFAASDESICIYDDTLLLKTKRNTIQLPEQRRAHGYVCLSPDGTPRWFTPSRDNVMTLYTAAAKDTLVFGDRSGAVYGVDVHDGHLRWQTDVSGIPSQVPTDDRFNAFGPPVIVGATILLYAGTQRHIVALDVQTGAITWQFEAERPALARAADDRSIYFITSEGRRYGVDLTTGAVRWSTPPTKLGDITAYSGLVVGEYFFAGFNNSHMIAAFSTQDGEMRWNYTGTDGFSAPPIYVDGRLVVGDDAGSIFCFVPS